MQCAIFIQVDNFRRLQTKPNLNLMDFDIQLASSCINCVVRNQDEVKIYLGAK